MVEGTADIGHAEPRIADIGPMTVDDCGFGSLSRLPVDTASVGLFAFRPQPLAQADVEPEDVFDGRAALQRLIAFFQRRAGRDEDR